MEKHHKFSIWYVIVGIWIVLIAHNILFSALSIQTIPYSRFLELVEKGEVTEMAISQNQIQGRMMTGEGGKGELFRTRVNFSGRFG